MKSSRKSGGANRKTSDHRAERTGRTKVSDGKPGGNS